MNGRGLLCALACLACAHPAPAPAPLGQIQLELYLLTPERTPGPVRARVLVDVTPGAADERTSLASSRDHDAHACRSALDWIAALPEGVEVQIQLFLREGRGPGTRCTPDLSARKTAVAESEEIWRVASASAALDRILDQRGASRVALISELGSTAAELCAPAEALSARGTWLEVVQLDAAPVALPDCLATRSLAAGAPAALAAPAPAPSFRVLRGNAQGKLLARGRAGEPPLELPAGPALVLLEVGGGEEIGPVRVRAGSRARIRVFELSAPAGSSPYGWVIEENDDAR